MDPPAGLPTLLLFLAHHFACSGGVWTSAQLVGSVRNASLGLGALSEIRLRVPRQAIQGMTGADTCALECIKDMSEAMGSLSGTTSGLIQSELFNKRQLDDFCHAYTSGKGCLKGCGQTGMISALMTAFSALDYLCIDHYVELVSHLGCFKDSEIPVKQNCDPRCGGMAQLRELQKQQQMAQQHQDLQETTRVLGQMCLQLDCETACQAPIIQRICRSEEAAVFMRRFARGSLQPLQEMMSEMGGQGYWPTACRVLASAASSATALGSSLLLLLLPLVVLR